MGKFEDRKGKAGVNLTFALIVLSFFLMELFAVSYLQTEAERENSWILSFGALWAVILSCLVRLLPWKAGRIAYGILYFLSLVYAVGQTGYYLLFGEMMWISEFLYASEGADYLDVLLSYPGSWFWWIVGLAALGAVTVWRFPRWDYRPIPVVLAAVMLACSGYQAFLLPQNVFVQDKGVRYSGSDYGRAQSQEAAYENMFNVHRLYQICGLYQTAAKDIYANAIFPHTPGYVRQQKENREQINAYFADDRDGSGGNEMTGLLAGKNVVLVLMESMDDWMIGTYTPTISRLMTEGIQFTRFYTPPYGGIRTFNTEFCINTGSFLSSQGGYAFDYVTNHFNQSLASQLRQLGYSAKTFHYNDPGFYSRNVFSPAMGYEEYVYYGDYLEGVEEEEAKQLLYDEQLLFDNPGLREIFFREGKKLNFIITRSAHLSYKYNEVLSYWGLKKYPQFRGLTGNEETDCALLKAKLVDDLFARLLKELEAQGELDNTVIIGVTDHYTYGYKDTQSLLMLSGVEQELLLEKTPCFIWSSDLEPMKVDKVLNTSDFLPTLLNLLGVDTKYDYIGQDAFDDGYAGFVPFSDGSWITGEYAFDAGTGEYLVLSRGQTTVPDAIQASMAEKVARFVEINNLILETDFYQ